MVLLLLIMIFLINWHFFDLFFEERTTIFFLKKDLQGIFKRL